MGKTITLKSEEFERESYRLLSKLPDFVKGKDITDIKNNRGIIVEDEIDKQSILFIGLNPSFPKGAPKLININGLRDEEYNPFHKFDVNEKLHPHYSKEKEISKLYGFTRISHIDLFFMRETDHSIIEQILFSTDPLCIAYVREQITLIERIIKEVDPIIIVVENSVVRSAFFKYSILDFRPGTDENSNGWNDEFGVDMLTINGHRVPIIFTGMLSSLNAGSYVTVKWQIKKLMRNRESWQ